MLPWEAEHGVDRERAIALVGATWPDLGVDAVHVGSGWDVDVWRFGETAVRFPRRAPGVGAVENELLVLPLVADRVGDIVRVPRPTRVADPVLDFPARFWAHEWLSGTQLLRGSLDDDALARLAPALGSFLRALHATPLAPLYAAGLRDDWRGDVARVAWRGLDWLGKVSLDAALADGARALLEAPPPPDFEPTLIHGDFHAGNLLVDDDGALAGVLDWGDCGAGDPAFDLAVVFSIVPPHARADFLDAYGAVTPATLARAKIGAVSRQGLSLLAWGQGLGDERVVDWATRSIARALSHGSQRTCGDP
jgi:aminoglycoside phosphotransferase (APT) family kinase protein